MNAETIRRVLSPHEQELLRRAGAGKSLRALSQIYRGTYDGENGVADALARIRAKVEAASKERPPEAHPLLAEDEDDNAGGIPIRTVPPGSINGDGAPDLPVPPTAGAPSSPTPPELANGNGSPAAATPPRNTHPRARERDERICAALAEQRMSAKRIQALVGANNIRTILGRLEDRGQVQRTDQRAYDWPYAVPENTPSVVWRLAEEPDDCRPADGLTDGPTLPPPRQGGARRGSELSPRDLLILKFLREHGQRCLRAAIVENVGIPDGSVNWHMRRLVADGCVKVEYEGRTPVYEYLAEPGEGTAPAHTPAGPEVLAGLAPETPESHLPAAPAPASTAVARQEPPPEPTVEEPITGERLTIDEVYDYAWNGMAETVSDEWMHEHAQSALLKWARNGQPTYFTEDPAGDAYFRLLLKLADSASLHSERLAFCDRIERLLWGPATP